MKTSNPPSTATTTTRRLIRGGGLWIGLLAQCAFGSEVAVWGCWERAGIKGGIGADRVEAARGITYDGITNGWELDMMAEGRARTKKQSGRARARAAPPTKTDISSAVSRLEVAGGYILMFVGGTNFDGRV